MSYRTLFTDARIVVVVVVVVMCRDDGRRGGRYCYFERGILSSPWDSVRWTGPRSRGEGGLGLGGRTTGPRHTGGRTYGRPVYVIGFTATARAAAFSSRVCILFARIIFFSILYFLLLFVSFAYNDNSVTFSRTCTT